MPGTAGGGLPDAEQIITADASGYLRELDRINERNDRWMAQNRQLLDSVRDVSRGLDEFERNLEKLRTTGSRASAFFDLSKVEKQLEHLDAQRQAVRGVSDEIWDQAVAQDNLIRKYENLGAAARRVTFEQDHLAIALAGATSEAADHSDAITVMARTHDVLAEASGRTAIRIHETRRAITQLTEEVNRSNEAAGRAEAAMTRVYGTPAGYGAYAPGVRPDTGTLSEHTIRGLVADEASRRFSSFLPAALLAGGGILGSGALLMAAAGGGLGGVRAGLGAVGGGIGNIAGAIGGMAAPGPTAADTSRAVTGFIRRWYGPAHWALMLSNELLATVGPALAAGTMGALTGVQGFEQLIPRGKAVFNTSESLGDSLGMTTGKAWGLKTSYLQNAQDLATGLAAQMAGAAVNIIGSPGTGGAFAQLGLNTDAMFARFMATLTQHFQKGGLGGKLGGLVTGGTSYLQQFGDTLANLGNTFMNLAPNLPGVGGDLLGLLSGGTGALAHLSGWLGGAAGPLLAGEAGLRWGPAIVGTAGRGIAGLGNLLGNAGRGGLLSRIGLGTATATGMEGGLAGLGAAIGGLGAPEIAAIAAGAFFVNKAATYQTPHALAVNQALDQISQLGFAPGYGASIQEMQKLAGVRPDSGWNLAGSPFGNIGGGLKEIYTGVNAWSPGQAFHGALRAGHGILQMAQSAIFGRAAFDPTPYQKNQTAINSLAHTMVNALNAGGQIQDQWQKLSGHAIDMAKATDVATMAQLQLGTAFQKNGRLSDQAKTMIANLYAGYAPMHMNAGMFGAATAAQTAMAGLQHTQVAAVNQAYDQLSQLVTGGAAASAGLFGLLGGTPVTIKKGSGIQLTAPPKGLKDMQKALAAGFTSPASAAAWNMLTNQQSGMFPALQGNLDWLRNAQVMNALGAGQTTGMAAYEMAQLMPMVGKSPAAMAMLSMYAQQFGMPGFKPGMSAKAMRTAMSRWLGGHAVTAGGFSRLMTLGTEGMANIGVDANQFVQNLGEGIGGPMSTAIFSRGEDLMKTFMAVAGRRGSTAALGNLANFMAGSGTPLAGAQEMVRYSAKLAGASPQSIASMLGQLKKDYEIYIKIHADTGALGRIKSQLGGVKFAVPPVKVHIRADGVATATQQIQGIRGKTVKVFAAAHGVGAAQAAINAVHGKVVDIVVRTIMTGGTVSQGALQQAGYAPGVSSSTIASIIRKGGGHAAGYRVPGYGGGDIHPALLEGGEAVVPKHLVAGIAPYLAAHKVPGFAGGGVVGQATYGPGAYWGMGSKMAMWNPALYAQLLAAMNATQPHVPPYISGPVHASAIHADAIHAAVTGGASAGTSSGKGVGPTLAQLNAEIRKAWQTLDKLYAQKDSGSLHGAALANLNAQIKNFWKTVLDPLYAQKDALTGGRHGSPVSSQAAQLAKIAKEFTIHLSGDIAKEVKNSAGAKNIATALISKLTQEVQYAKGVQASMKAGLNLGGMDVTPGTGQGTVYEQMQSYSKSLSSFSGDLSKLGKGHLNKELMKQIVAAGPVQGDALAQSILNDYGGIGAVNKQYAQIVKQANKLGIKASELQYGGHLSDNLRSATVSSHGININVNLNKGAGGTLDLTPEQVAAIVAKVQAALLKQAKKNKQTGVKAHGKSA